MGRDEWKGVWEGIRERAVFSVVNNIMNTDFDATIIYQDKFDPSFKLTMGYGKEEPIPQTTLTHYLVHCLKDSLIREDYASCEQLKQELGRNLTY